MIITDGETYVAASYIDSWWAAERGGTDIQLTGSPDPVQFQIPVNKFTRLMMVVRQGANLNAAMLALIKDNHFRVLESCDQLEYLKEPTSDDLKTDTNTKAYIGTKTELKAQPYISIKTENISPYIGIKTANISTAIIDDVQPSRWTSQYITHLKIEVVGVNYAGLPTGEGAIYEDTLERIMSLFGVNDFRQLEGKKIIAYWSSPYGSPALVGIGPVAIID